MDNISKEMEILRKNQKEMQEIKNTKPEKKNVSDGFINRMNPDEERLWVWGYDNKPPQWKQRKKEQRPKKPEQNIQELWEITKQKPNHNTALLKTFKWVPIV